MSVKKKIPSLCKLCLFYEEIPEEFLDETDEDNYFYHHFLNISQSQYQIMRVSTGSKKNRLKSSCSSTAIERHSNVLSSKKKRKSPKKTSLPWSTVCAIFSKHFIELASVYRKLYQSPDLKLNLQSQKTISLLIIITISLNNQIDKFAYRSDLETTSFAYFPSKCLNYTAIIFFSQKLSTLSIWNFTISTRTDITLQTSVNKWEQLWCGAHSLGLWVWQKHYYSHWGRVLPKYKVFGKLCLYKKIFQSLGRSDYQCPQCTSVCQVRNIFFVDQTKSFFVVYSGGFSFSRTVQNQFKVLMEMCIVLAIIVPTERKENLLPVM